MKHLHALCLASALLATQSQAQTSIYVDTASDENGENTLNCSLREAITAVNTRVAFGGCRAGELYGTNTIHLKNETYKLTKGELIISHEVTIEGFDTTSTTLQDTIQSFRLRRMPPTTTIDGNFQRVFNSAIDKSSLHLKNLIITRGKADFGAAILAGGQVSTSNTIFTDNEASKSGGVIYLSGRNATILIAESTLSKNKAETGAVLGMSCTDHLNPVTRSITINSSSIVGNGGSDNNSIIQGCGQIALAVNASTIAKNTAKTTGGILYFVDEMDSTSSVSFKSSTLVENKLAPTLAYGKLGTLTLNQTIIAFNDLGCSAKAESKTAYNGGLSVGGYNTIQNCSFNYSLTDLTPKTDINLDDASNAGASFATELHPLANYGGVTDTYLPKLSSKYILNRAFTSLCDADQRGNETPLKSTDICDIGSVERRTAVAIFDSSLTLDNKNETDRISETDVLANDRTSETEASRGAFGKDAAGNYLIELTVNPNNQCSIVQRTNDRPLIRFDNKGQTLAEDQAVTCKYKFTDSNGNVSTEGELRFRTVNKTPVAGDDSYTLPIGSSGIPLDLLVNDNDKNDGIYGSLCSDATNVNCNGFFIRVVSQPTEGVIEAERTGNCPDYSDGNKFRCYGGKITYRVKNAGSPFDDKFTYVVYDVDKAASNEATVTIINQAGAAEASNSGSLGWLSLFTLGGLAAYRRLRKSHVA